MKFRVWTGMITFGLALVILLSYTEEKTEYTSVAHLEPDVQPPKTNRSTEEETEQINEEDLQQDSQSEKTASPCKIRVLLKNENFESSFHRELAVSSDSPFEVQWQGEDWQEEPLRYLPEDTFRLDFSQEIMEKGGRITFVPEDPQGFFLLHSLKRAQGTPAYHGRLEVLVREEGFVVINELLLEEYLPAVLSSEMSEAFPMEALKAQAVSARTYARKKIEEKNKNCFGADLDDSVSYQVYNNFKENETVLRAVHETEGLVLREGDQLADVYYYSTSSGARFDDRLASEEALEAFIREGRSSDLEYKESWYRWHTEVSAGSIMKYLMETGALKPEQADYEQLLPEYGADFKETGQMDSHQEHSGGGEYIQNSDQTDERAVSEGEENIRNSGQTNERAVSRGEEMSRNADQTDFNRAFSTGEEDIWDSVQDHPEQILHGNERNFRLYRAYVAERRQDGQAQTLVLEGEDWSVSVQGEYEIRRALAPTDTVHLQDGSTAQPGVLLPSAWFFLEKQEEGAPLEKLSIRGGGFGHGNGLSQNGARLMAEQGADFGDILSFYYPKAQIVPEIQRGKG